MKSQFDKECAGGAIAAHLYQNWSQEKLLTAIESQIKLFS